MLVVIGRLSWLRFFNTDELEAAQSAWKVLQGQRPYFDFFQHHHPLLYHVLAPLLGILGDDPRSLLVARGFHFGVLVATLAVTQRLGRELFGARAGLVAAVLLATTAVFVGKGIEIRPDGPQSLLGLCGLWLFVRHDRTRAARDVLLAGGAMGLSFLFLQKAVWAIFFLGVAALARILARRMTWGALALGVAGFLVPVLPWYGWIAATGSLEDYFLLNWTLNTAVPNGFSAFHGFVGHFEENTVLWVFFAVALVETPRGWRERELALYVLALFLTLFTLKRPWPQYYLTFLPGVAILAAAAITRIAGSRDRLLLAVVLLGAVPGAHYLTSVASKTNERKLAMIGHVLSLTDATDRVYDGEARVNVFRPDLDWFWFSVGGQGCLERYRLFRPYEHEPESLIRRQRPAVVSLICLPRFPETVAAERYRPSPEFPELYVRRDLLPAEAGSVEAR